MGTYFWMHNPTAMISIFAAAGMFKLVCPAFYARLVAVGSWAGIECQHEIRDLTMELNGMFAGQIHHASIQALMLFIGCPHGSLQANLLNSMLSEYLQTPAHHLALSTLVVGTCRLWHGPPKLHAASFLHSSCQLQGATCTSTQQRAQGTSMLNACSYGPVQWRP